MNSKMTDDVSNQNIFNNDSVCAILEWKTYFITKFIDSNEQDLILMVSIFLI
jgi:hypothetical protein